MSCEYDKKIDVYEPRKMALFVPENLKKTKTKMSPSGRYRLTIEYYTTGTGSWEYTKGIVHRVEDDKHIISLYRDYSSFTHKFFMRFGEEWLFSGEHYEYQTLVNLDTGKRYDNNEGYFCWTDVNASPKGDILLVEGCVWACPYEYDFYDLSNIVEDGKCFWKRIDEEYKGDPRLKEISNKKWEERTEEEKDFCNQYSYRFFPDDENKIKWVDDYTLIVNIFEDQMKKEKKQELNELREKDSYAFIMKEWQEYSDYYDRVIYRTYQVKFERDENQTFKAKITDITVRPFIIIEGYDPNREDEEEEEDEN